MGDDWDAEREGWEAVIEGWGGSDRGLGGKQLRNNLSCPSTLMNDSGLKLVVTLILLTFYEIRSLILCLYSVYKVYSKLEKLR
jgi:hypothetical protein